MKVVHINWSDTEGGAAIAATRLCEAMRASGIDASLLTLKKNGRKVFVKKIHLGLKSLLSTYYNIELSKRMKEINPTGTFSLMNRGFDFTKASSVMQADVIFIHWVNNSTLSIKGIERLLKLGKPIIWFMHDMFPITGGCHHSLGCNEYINSCMNCPLINNDRNKSIASKQLKAKIHSWTSYSNLQFIAPSEWLGDCIKQSRIAQSHQVHVIPNLINIKVYHPVKADLKPLLGLDSAKKTIMFSAATYSSVYKGSRYMHDFLSMLDPLKYEALAIGLVNEDFQKDLNIRIVSTGYLNDDLSMVVAYNCCDVFVISSVAENYPNVLLEAMACGKPCVGFPVGGISDLIKDKLSGCLTTGLDSKELRDGVEYVFSSPEIYNSLSCGALSVAKSNAYENIQKLYSNIECMNPLN